MSEYLIWLKQGKAGLPTTSDHAPATESKTVIIL